MTLWHLQMLVLWILANCALPWYTIWHNKRLRPDPKRDEERFKPFVRSDYDNFSYTRCLWTHFCFLPRFIMHLGIMFFAVGMTKLICIGVSIDNLDDTRKNLILKLSCFCMWLFGPLFGCIWYSTHRPKGDDSKWLGPDWKPHYDGATMYISNHMNWNEIFNTFLFVRPMPGFIAKIGVK